MMRGFGNSLSSLKHTSEWTWLWWHLMWWAHTAFERWNIIIEHLKTLQLAITSSSAPMSMPQDATSHLVPSSRAIFSHEYLLLPANACSLASTLLPPTRTCYLPLHP
jgi:hypothetical protein